MAPEAKAGTRLRGKCLDVAMETDSTARHFESHWRAWKKKKGYSESESGDKQTTCSELTECDSARKT